MIGETTSRWAGIVLLAAFALGLGYMVVASRTHRFLDAGEILEAVERPRRWWAPPLLTLLGIGAITVGAELVTYGAQGMIGRLSPPAALIGMVATPAAIELEEIIRQAVPAREGHPDVSAGNLVGTVLYFVLFNLGLIALAAPVRVSPLTRTFDWPFLVVCTWLAAAFLWRGGVSRVQGAVLLALYAVYVGAHVPLEVNAHAQQEPRLTVAGHSLQAMEAPSRSLTAPESCHSASASSTRAPADGVDQFFRRSLYSAYLPHCRRTTSRRKRAGPVPSAAPVEATRPNRHLTDSIPSGMVARQQALPVVVGQPTCGVGGCPTDEMATDFRRPVLEGRNAQTDLCLFRRYGRAAAEAASSA